MRQLGYVGSADQRSLVSELMTRLLGRLAQLVEAAKDDGKVDAASALIPSARSPVRHLLLPPGRSAQRISRPGAVRPRPAHRPRIAAARTGLITRRGPAARLQSRTNARRPRAAGRTPMPARTGRQFLDGLKEPREIYVGADKVADVASHPAFRGGAEELAADLRPAARRGRPLPRARSGDRRADQRQPHDPALARRPLQAPRGAGGLRRAQRRPDGPHAGLHERHLRRLRGATGRVVARAATRPARRTSSRSRRSCGARTSRSPTPSSTRPSTRPRATFREPGNDVALHKVGETEHGIIVRGSRILATLAPFADEMAVYPALSAAARAPTPTPWPSASR